MSESDKKNNEHEAGQSASMGRQDMPSALDKAFPSLWFMGSVIFVVILAVMIMGWKVAGLEDERVVLQRDRQELQHQQEAFEKEKSLYQKLKQELPELVRQRELLDGDISTLKGELKVQQTIFDTITADLTRAREGLDEAQRKTDAALKDREQVQEDLQDLNAGVGKSQRLVSQLTRQKTALQGRVKGLLKDQEILESSVENLRKSKGDLGAQVASLESRVVQKKAELERYTRDDEAFARLSDGFQAVLEKLESSSGQMQKSASTLERETEGVKSATESITKTVRAFGDATTRLGVQNGDLAKGVKGITAAVQKAEQSVQEMQGAARSFAGAGEEMASTARDAGATQQQLESVRHDLTSTSEKLVSEGRVLEKQVATLGAGVSKVVVAVEPVQNMSNSLQEVYQGIKESGRTLTALVKTQEDTSRQLIERIKNLQAQASDLEASKGNFVGLETFLSEQSRNLKTLLQDIMVLRGRLEALVAKQEAASFATPVPRGTQAGSAHADTDLTSTAPQPQ